MARAAFIVAAALSAGCLRGPLAFELNTEGRDPEQVSLAQGQAIAEALEELFGTPDEPRIPEGVGLDPDLLEAAAGPLGADQQGNPRGLYRQHCAACHGISGDGVGPAAQLFNPYPRDLRSGVFKYTSTVTGAKPAREDLRRTLREGVHGTAMPSFRQVSLDQREALIEYVTYLGIRGETELYLLSLVVDEDEYLPLGADAKESIAEEARWFDALWAEAEGKRVVPPPGPPVNTPELLAASVARGRKLYASEDAECVKCHGPEGEGDGEEPELYDNWNKPKSGVSPEETKRLARRFKLPLQELRPRDYTQGTFRGGNRPVDLYWRVYVGIKGTAMPAAGPTPGAKGVYTPEEIWDLVHYILSLDQ